MDKKYIEENEIEIKYLRNLLTDEELEEFEVYLMENPELVDQLELDAALTNDLKENRACRVELPRKQRFLAKLVVTPVFSGVFSFALGALAVGVLFNSFEGRSGSAQVAYVSDIRGMSGGQQSVAEFAFPETSFSFWSRDQFILIVDSGFKANTEYAGHIERIGDTSSPKIYSTASYRTDQFGNLSIPFFVKDYSIGEYQINLQAVKISKSEQTLLRYRFSLFSTDNPR